MKTYEQNTTLEVAGKTLRVVHSTEAKALLQSGYNTTYEKEELSDIVGDTMELFGTTRVFVENKNFTIVIKVEKELTPAETILEGTMANFGQTEEQAKETIRGILYMLERGNKQGLKDRDQVKYYFYSEAMLDGMDAMGASDAQYDFYSLMGQDVVRNCLPVKDYRELVELVKVKED